MLNKGKKVGANPTPSSTKQDKGRKEKGDQQNKEDKEFPCKNSWPYKDEIPIMPESSKLTDTDLLTLSCHDRYRMKSIPDENTDCKIDLYTIHGSMVGRTTDFMCQWLGLMVHAHKTKFDVIAESYLKKKKLTLSEWLNGVKKGVRANTMALFMLCTLTDTHTVVHLKNRKYWTTKRDEPTEHNVYLERCNTHLCYVENGKYVELETCTL